MWRFIGNNHHRIKETLNLEMFSIDQSVLKSQIEGVHLDTIFILVEEDENDTCV